MDLRTATDSDLLLAAPRNAAAFGEFYDRHEEAVLVFMLRRTPTPETAADLTAETFAAALCSAKRYSRTGAPATAWLFTIANRALSASYRKQRVTDRARRKLSVPRIAIDDDTAEHLERLSRAGIGETRWPD